MSLQIVLLGVVCALPATVIDGADATLASTVRDRLTRSGRARQRLYRTTGGVHVGLGGLAVLG